MSDYCHECNLRVAPNDRSRIIVGQFIFHAHCWKKYLYRKTAKKLEVKSESSFK